MNSKASDVSEGVEQRARELLAAELGCPVKSNTELDLSDKDRVFTEDAIAAIVKALSPPLPSLEVERLHYHARCVVKMYEAIKTGTNVDPQLARDIERLGAALSALPLDGGL